MSAALAQAAKISCGWLDAINRKKATFRDMIKAHDPLTEDKRYNHDSALANVAWAYCGFPTVNVDKITMAAFASTSIPATGGLGIELPFPSFAIRIPEIFWVAYEGDENLRIGEFLIVSDVPRCAKTLPSDGGFSDFILVRSLGPYGTQTISTCFDRVSKEQINSGYKIAPIKNKDVAEHLSGFIKRVAFGICAHIDEKEIDVAKNSASKNRHRRPGQQPTLWAPLIFRKTRCDLVKETVAFLRNPTKGRKLINQHIVRGHHKRQPFGNGDRKLIWVEPYWRGPVDAPMVVRMFDVCKDCPATTEPLATTELACRPALGRISSAPSTKPPKLIIGGRVRYFSLPQRVLAKPGLASSSVDVSKRCGSLTERSLSSNP